MKTQSSRACDPCSGSGEDMFYFLALHHDCADDELYITLQGVNLKNVQCNMLRSLITIVPVCHPPQAQCLGPTSSETPLFSSSPCLDLTLTVAVFNPHFFGMSLSHVSKCSSGVHVLLFTAGILFTSDQTRIPQLNSTSPFLKNFWKSMLTVAP